MALNQIETVESRDKKVTQYIVVQIGSEKYGIDISYVDNIVRMQKITRVPKAQPYFKGIINLRGEIVPVMSIRKKMGLEEDVETGASRIIILKIEEKGWSTLQKIRLRPTISPQAMGERPLSTESERTEIS